MYNVSDEYISKLNTGILENNRQITGTIKLLSGDIISLDNSFLSSGSLSIDNKCSNSSDLQLGSCYIGKMTLSIFGDYSRYAFINATEGAEISLDYQLDSQHIPLGIYNVYDCTKKGEVVTISAYDNITKLNKTLNTDNTNGTALSVIKWVCSKCGVELANTEEELMNYPNIGVVCNINSDSYNTYQAVISSVMELIGAFAYADRDGKLRIRKFSAKSIFNMQPMLRTKITPADYDVYYTKLVETDSNNIKYNAITGNGTGLTYQINNKLVTGSDAIKQKIVNNILDQIKDINYTPADINIVYNPMFDLGDMITVKADGIILKDDINILITEYKYNLNGTSYIKSVGSNRFLMSSDITSDKNQFSSDYNNLKQNGSYISTYNNIESYEIGSNKQGIAYLEMVVGESEKTAISGQCSITVTNPGTVKIIYSHNDIDDTFTPEQYLTAGKHIINFNSWFDINEKERNNVNFYNIYLQSDDGLAGTVDIDKIKIYILSSVSSEGMFTPNNVFYEEIDMRLYFNDNYPVCYGEKDNTNKEGVLS